MAQIEEDRKVRQNSFGDAAAANAAVTKAVSTREAPTLFNKMPAGATAPNAPEPAPQGFTPLKAFPINPGYLNQLDKDAAARQARANAPKPPPIAPADTTFARAMNAAQTQLDQQTASASPVAPVAPVAPADTTFARGMNAAQAQLDQQTASGPATVAQPPARVAVGDPGWRTKAVMDGAAEDAKAAFDKGEYGQTAGALVRGAVTAVPTAMVDFGEQTLAPLAGGAKGFLRGLVGGEDAPTVPDTARPAAAPPAAARTPAAATPATTPATAAPTAQPGATQTPAQGAATNPAAPKQDPMTGAPVNGGNTVQVTRQPNGVMEFSGQNIKDGFSYTGNSGFQPSGAGVTVVPALRPTAAAPASQPAGITAPTQQKPGLGFTQQEARAMLDQAMTKQRGESRADFATRSGAALRALGLETDERGNIRSSQTQQRGQDLNANTANADRSSREAIEGGRQGLDAQRLSAEQQANGFKVRTGEMQERLFNEWVNAKTPEEKATAAERLRMLQGGDQDKSRLMVVPGGQEWNEQAGAVLTRPGFLFDQGSGQFIPMPGQGSAGGAPAGPKPAVGSTSNVNGKIAVFNGTEWVPQSK